jgi:hypothetical protein
MDKDNQNTGTFLIPNTNFVHGTISKTDFMSTHIYTAPFTKTLTVSKTPNLSIPGYLRGGLNIDFSKDEELAVGGFGIIHLGTLLKEDFVKNENGGNYSCVVKTPFEVNSELFLQEISIHEVFRKEKLFCKLLYYSENPYHIVLKYYRYGPLFHFIFSKTSIVVPVKYSLGVCLHLAERMAYAF